MGLLFYENKEFAGGAVEENAIKAVHFGGELLWPHVPIVITVDTSISPIITVRNISGYVVSWGDGISDLATDNIISHTYSSTKLYDIKINGLNHFPDYFLFEQKNVIEINTSIKVVGIGYQAFYNCASISVFKADLSLTTRVDFAAFSYAFKEGSHIELNFSNKDVVFAQRIFAFSKIYKVTIKPTSTTNVSTSMFLNCLELKEVYLGKVSLFDYEAFCNCSSISVFKADLSTTTGVGYCAFSNAFKKGSHVELNFSCAGILVSQASFANSSVYKITINPTVGYSLSASEFSGCSELIEIDLGQPLSFGYAPMDGCVGLQTVRLHTLIPPLYAPNIPKNLLQSIFVPASSLLAYKSAPNWVNYADYMRGF